MNVKTQFDSENFLMSVFGHLILIAVAMLSFSVVVERAKLVSPNRIQIVEIDLKNVKISGDETRLYNTTKPEEKTEEKAEEKPQKEEKNTKNTLDEKIELKQPTMIEDESKNKTSTPAKKEENKKTENKPLPRKKTVVKVNREALSLDRTMTVSVTDALRVALTRCWTIDKTHPGIEDIRLTAHMKLLPTGVVDRLWFDSESRANTDPDFAYVLETAKSAIKTCSPFSILPRNEYEKWKDIKVTFYPSSGQVM